MVEPTTFFGEFNLGEFIGVTVILFGLAAFLMGQALAETWRPIWQNVGYGFLLAFGNHFIHCALFSGEWLSSGQYLLDVVVIVAIALFAYRVTLARKMVNQYPWLYVRSGLFSWRDSKRTGRD